MALGYLYNTTALCVSQVCKYVTLEKVDPKKRYTYEKAPGQIVLLEGKAKDWAIEVQTLKNQANRLKNIYNLSSILFGVGLSVRAWMTQSYFPLIVWTPFMALGHNIMWRKLESFYPVIAALNVGISTAVGNEANRLIPQPKETKKKNGENGWVYIENNGSKMK